MKINYICMTYPSITQTRPTAIKGQRYSLHSVKFSKNVLINPSTVASFSAGTAVKIIDSSLNSVVVDKASANDKIYGFIEWTVNKNNFIGGDYVAISTAQADMYMEAGAAINAGADLEINSTNNTVITNAGVNTVVGRALKKAIQAGDLIPVEILAPLK